MDHVLLRAKGTCAPAGSPGTRKLDDLHPAGPVATMDSVKLGARFRGFSDQELVEGGEAAQRRAQAELRREQRLHVAMTSGWPELRRSDLEPAHLGLLEHEPTGDFYAVTRGEQFGENYDTAAAFYIDPAGDAVFLERPASGAKSRAELEQAQARRAERRKQPRPRPTWMSL